MIQNRSATALCLIAVCMLVSMLWTKTATARQTFADIPEAVAGLLGSDADDAFLVIEIAGTRDFVQLAGGDGTAYVDFPMITERQKANRKKVESVCGELGLPLTVTSGPDGVEFLDYDLPRDPGEIASIVKELLSRIYDVSPETHLNFITNGL